MNVTWLHIPYLFFSTQVKITSMNKGPPVLPVTTKDNDPLHLCDMHAGSEAYHIDIDASYRSSPMKII